MMQFSRIFLNGPWEAQIGYCRAIRAGNQIFVTGTAPINADGTTHAPGNAYLQACRCFDLIKEVLNKLGANFENVVRTRMFVTDITRWPEFGRAHQQYLGEHPPATTMVEVKALIAPDMLIEVEADAVLWG